MLCNDALSFRMIFCVSFYGAVSLLCYVKTEIVQWLWKDEFESILKDVFVA